MLLILLAFGRSIATMRTIVSARPEMPVPQGQFRQQGPSCLDRIKLGFTMGFCVGLATGVIFGGFNGLRYGLRGRELIQTVGKASIQGGGTFGTFMAIGSGIRC